MDRQLYLCREYDDLVEDRKTSPEAALVVAFLARGLRDYQIAHGLFVGCRQKSDCFPSYVAAESRRWLLSSNIFPFSFLWCCDILDLNPERVRAIAQKRPIIISKEPRQSEW